MCDDPGEAKLRDIRSRSSYDSEGVGRCFMRLLVYNPLDYAVNNQKEVRRNASVLVNTIPVPTCGTFVFVMIPNIYNNRA